MSGMKLRLALKVMSNVDRGKAYRKGTLLRAMARIDQADRFLRQLQQWLGVEGQAGLRAKTDPAGAFRMLMETDESKWKGNGRFPSLLKGKKKAGV